jgi:hypothetical protein
MLSTRHSLLHLLELHLDRAQERSLAGVEAEVVDVVAGAAVVVDAGVALGDLVALKLALVSPKAAPLKAVLYPIHLPRAPATC